MPRRNQQNILQRAASAASGVKAKVGATLRRAEHVVENKIVAAERALGSSVRRGVKNFIGTEVPKKRRRTHRGPAGQVNLTSRAATTCVKSSDFLGTMTGLSGAFNICYQQELSVLNPLAFPKAVQIISNFESYRFKHIEWVMTTDRGSLSTDSRIGHVDGAITYDPDDLPLTSEIAIRNYGGCRAFSADTKRMTWRYDAKQAVFQRLFINHGTNSALQSHGRFVLASNGLPSAGAIGTLTVNYEIELTTFRMPDPTSLWSRYSQYFCTVFDQEVDLGVGDYSLFVADSLPAFRTSLAECSGMPLASSVLKNEDNTATIVTLPVGKYEVQFSVRGNDTSHFTLGMAGINGGSVYNQCAASAATMVSYSAHYESPTDAAGFHVTLYCDTAEVYTGIQVWMHVMCRNSGPGWLGQDPSSVQTSQLSALEQRLKRLESKEEWDVPRRPVKTPVRQPAAAPGDDSSSSTGSSSSSKKK